ncbi:MAG: WGR domain-containing protein [Hyphomicrobiales bacterium]|nr:MAG: WGR domain-containing protein [Hyphomicrobiales bacterium]
MPAPETTTLHLRRIDPARNMARFYLLSIQPTLFGGASLVRNWGRIGTSGKAMIETFDEDVGADQAFSRVERRKRQRGYVGLAANSQRI